MSIRIIAVKVTVVSLVWGGLIFGAGKVAGQKGKCPAPRQPYRRGLPLR